MPYSPLNRFEEIDTGGQIDTWGITENKNKERLDQTLDGVLNLVVSGDRSLVYSNGTDDEAHYMGLNVTSGGGGSIVFQATQAFYIVRNGTTGNVTLRHSVGANTVIQPGSVAGVMVHPTAGVIQIGPTGGDMKAYIDDGVQSAKTYADNLAFESASAQLPGQSGAAGKYLSTNGSVAGWSQITQSDVEDLVEDRAAQRAFNIALAFIT